MFKMRPISQQLILAYVAFNVLVEIYNSEHHHLGKKLGEKKGSWEAPMQRHIHI